MIFKKTKIRGVYLIKTQPARDRRGFFSRIFCQREFKKQGLSFKVVQSNFSYNKKRGTLRGMHYQIPPHEEIKLVSCLQGKIYDVVIDLRPISPTYLQWIAVELSAKNNKMLYIPKGLAHGFQILDDNTLVFYQMSEFYHPQSARGICWDDPQFKINWPIKKTIISSKDRSYKFLKTKK